MQTKLLNFKNYPTVDLYKNYMMIISRSFKMKQRYHLITSKYHMSYSFSCIDLNNFSNNLSTLGIKDEILIYRILSENKFSTLSEDERKILVYHSPSLLNLQFVVQILTLSELFNMSFFQHNMLKCSEIELSRNIIFIVEDIRYLDLLAELKTQRVTLSGGSYNYQHILSPNKFRLSQIISCIENGRQRGVNNSYHKDKKLELYGDNILLDSTKTNLN